MFSDAAGAVSGGRDLALALPLPCWDQTTEDPMRVLALILVLATYACDSPWAVEMEVPIREVPADYFVWYQEVATCMGISESVSPVRFQRIRWFSAVDIYNADEGVHAVGLWTEPHRITLRTDSQNDPLVVKHELVHDLLGVGSHPPPYFLRCAGI